MPYTQKTLTQRQIINKISKFDWNRKGAINQSLNFWNTQSEFVNKLITEKKFNKNEFEILNNAFNELSSCFNHSDNRFFDNNTSNKDPELIKSFRDICKSEILLLIQFNEKFDKVLENFDINSSYYKKLKSLSLVRYFKGSKEDYKNNFKKISDLLYEAIEIDPACQDDCCNIVIEYLGNIFNPDGKFIISEVSNIDRINFLYEFGNLKFIEILNKNQIFKRKFFREWFFADNRSKNIEGVNEIIDGIFSARNVNGINKETILKEIEPELSEYIKKINDFRESEEYYWESYVDFLNKYKGIKENQITELKEEDIEKDYHELYQKYLGNYKNRDLYEISKFDVNNVDHFVDYFCQEAIVLSMTSSGVILGCMDEIPEKEINEFEKKINSYSKKITEFKNKCIEDITGEKVKCPEYEFKVINLGEDFRNIIRVKRFGEIAESKYTKLNGCLGEASEFENIIINLHSLISKSLNYKSNLKNNNTNSLNKELETNQNWEPNEDKEQIKKLKESLSKIDSQIDEYKKTIDKYYAENIDLQKKINELNSLLTANGISTGIKIQEENIIEKRKDYKILIVGGSETANKQLKQLFSKNKEFMDKLENIYHLDPKKIETKRDIEKQQHNKNLAKELENKLIFGSIDFAIILQSDHNTALKNLIEDPNYSTRITEFGELEDGKITQINQKFSYTKFDYYLKRAIDKYETMQNNNSMALR